MRKLVLCVGLGCMGLLAGCGGGSAALSSGSGNQGTPGPVVLKSIAISPSNSSILPLTSTQFTAKGNYSDGSTKDLTTQASWNSSPNTVASVSNSVPTIGVVQASSTPGVSVITAALGSVVNLTQLTVSSVNLKSIAVTPSTAGIPLGAQQQFTATATYSDGSTKDVTDNATWTSAAPAVATVTTKTGLVTALDAGSASIAAQLCDSSGNCISSDGTQPRSTSAKLTVNADNMVSVSVQPGSSSIAAGTKLQFSAAGLFNDGSTRDLTGLSTWASSDSKVAPIGLTTGLAGPGKFSSKSTDNNTTTVTTSIGVPSVIGGTCPGNSQLSTDGSTCVFTGKSSLSVANPLLRSLQSIIVTPSTASIAPSTQVVFAALGAFSDSTTQDLTDQISWFVASTAAPKMSDTCNNKIATTTISRFGIATGTNAATCDVTATSTGLSSNPVAMLTVTSAALTSIAITPAIPVVAPGSNLQLVATGTFSDNSTQDITGLVKWSSSDSTVAPVDEDGIVTGEGIGSAIITATLAANAVTLNPVSSTTNVLVEPLKSIAVTAPAQSFAAGSSIQLNAIGTFPDGNTQDLTGSAIWSSSAAAVATVGSSPGEPGNVAGLTAGPVTVTAAFDTITATVPLTVATLTSIAITDANSFNISSGTSDQLKATGTLSDGTSQDLTGDVVWSSSTPTVAVVDSEGLATGTGKGSTAVTATFEESTPVTITATLTVH